MVLMGESSNLFPLLESVNLTENDTNNASTNPNPTPSNHKTNISPQKPPKIKRKRNPPGKPDPNAEVIALSPEILLATNRFFCEICQKGFQREQNLHLHMRGHNIYIELKRMSSEEIRKKVYICPEPTCVHHHPSRALGDITGIKKHFSRKHVEKNLKCEKCPKVYALESDWKAHSKMCGTKEYRCDCGTSFSRKDIFRAHRSFCVTLDQARISTNTLTHQAPPLPPAQHPFHHQQAPPLPPTHHQSLAPLFSFPPAPQHQNHLFFSNPYPLWDPPTPNPNPMWNPPATNPSMIPFLKNADSVGSHTLGHVGSSTRLLGPFGQEDLTTWRNGDMPYASMGLQEVLNFTEINGEGGAEFAFAADPAW